MFYIDIKKTEINLYPSAQLICSTLTLHVEAAEETLASRVAIVEEALTSLKSPMYMC